MLRWGTFDDIQSNSSSSITHRTRGNHACCDPRSTVYRPQSTLGRSLRADPHPPILNWTVQRGSPTQSKLHGIFGFDI